MYAKSSGADKGICSFCFGYPELPLMAETSFLVNQMLITATDNFVSYVHKHTYH